ncbi:hypothetical protein DES39_0086 [Orbus hercynius]|uniref:ParB-like nuclease family protein n=1 Tax=Orbus hercynius TaxID=593135 RepID=A0A495RH81_9GAMM|nr:hypothetical protein [Orbus hercynius]RKS86883.1 hypothetical protein DES39_0086 [Orbus hercynius]
MSKSKSLPVDSLAIDLNNFRTVTQKNEINAINAMISISPDYFWALTESLLDTGYLPTENIIILEYTENSKKIYLVKEGNRRIASLKIILGLVDKTSLDIPQHILKRITNLSNNWLIDNTSVPCAIYPRSSAELVDKIVNLTHGKSQKAGRDDWETVAKARHNKKMNKAEEPGLDLLEKYLEYGSNITHTQKTKWAGKFHLSVLDEAMKKIFPRLGLSSSIALANKYPNIVEKNAIDKMIYDIGLEKLSFPIIRGKDDFALVYGLPPNIPVANGQPPSSTTPTGASNTSTLSVANAQVIKTNQQTGTAGTTSSSSVSTSSSSYILSTTVATASATNNQSSVRKNLRALKLVGQNRNKIVTIRSEMLNLKIKENPIAFCFLLRALFELSAKAYCDDLKKQGIPNAPSYIKNDGSDRTLSDVLRDITTYLNKNNTDKQMVKLLHGAITELAKKDGVLSVTSMNQLVHNPSFTIAPGDIPIFFSNIYPLLEQMHL